FHTYNCTHISLIISEINSNFSTDIIAISMRNKRRDFIKFSGMTGIVIARGLFNNFANDFEFPTNTTNSVKKTVENDNALSVIGGYGAWAAGLIESKLPSLSFRRNDYNNLQSWKKTARQRLTDRLSMPPVGDMPKVTVKKQYDYDGLHIEE